MYGFGKFSLNSHIAQYQNLITSQMPIPLGNQFCIFFLRNLKTIDVVVKKKTNKISKVEVVKFVQFIHSKEQLSKAVTLYTADGRKMLAIDVFSAAIKYLRGHLLDTLEKRWTDMRETDIQWVLMVPDIWDDAAKQFMREAADKVR